MNVKLKRNIHQKKKIIKIDAPFNTLVTVLKRKTITNICQKEKVTAKKIYISIYSYTSMHSDRQLYNLYINIDRNDDVLTLPFASNQFILIIIYESNNNNNHNITISFDVGKNIQKILFGWT